MYDEKKLQRIKLSVKFNRENWIALVLVSVILYCLYTHHVGSVVLYQFNKETKTCKHMHWNMQAQTLSGTKTLATYKTFSQQQQ